MDIFGILPIILGVEDFVCHLYFSKLIVVLYKLNRKIGID